MSSEESKTWWVPLLVLVGATGYYELSYKPKAAIEAQVLAAAEQENDPRAEDVKSTPIPKTQKSDKSQSDKAPANIAPTGPTLSPIKQGMYRQEVITSLGAPSSIVNSKDGYMWAYGVAFIEFKNHRVTKADRGIIKEATKLNKFKDPRREALGKRILKSIEQEKDKVTTGSDN